MGYIWSWKRILLLWNPLSKLFFIRLFQQKTCKPTKFLNQLFCSQTSKYQQDYCVYMSCWAFPCRSGSRFLVGPTRPRMGRRPAFLSGRAPKADKYIQGCHAHVRSIRKPFVLASRKSIRPARPGIPFFEACSSVPITFNCGSRYSINTH